MSEKKREWTWESDGMKVVRSIARSGPGCHQGCGVLLYVKDGKLVKVEGDLEFPSNQGRLCPRCLALTEVVYHPDRLKYPLKRAGERGRVWDFGFGGEPVTFREVQISFRRNPPITTRDYGKPSFP